MGMAMQKIQMEVSPDIFDKVMFFLENLPRNKAKITITNPDKPSLRNTQKRFGDFLSHTQQVDRIMIVDRDALHAR